MTQEHQEYFELWKTIFPAWPKELFEKFRQSIVIDFPRFGLLDFYGVQSWWGSVISPPAQATYQIGIDPYQADINFSFSLGNPTNSQYATTARWDIQRVPIQTMQRISASWQLPPTPPNPLQVNNAVNSSGDIFSNFIWTPSPNFHVYMPYDVRLYYPNFQWNYSVIAYHSGAWTPEFDFMSGNHWNINYTAFILNVAPNASAMPYNAVDTILAMHENGMDFWPDYALMYEYQSYRNAMMKFSNQIDSKIALAKDQSAADVKQYKQDFDDRLQREISDLNTKKFQILQAMQNDQKSAMRDYQSQILAAQNLKISLRAAMRG